MNKNVDRPRWYTDEERKAYGCDLQIVYALIDPTVEYSNKTFEHLGAKYSGELFYIGRTKNLLDRFLQHVRGDNSGSDKDERIRMITRSGKLPLMITLHEACSDKEAVFKEAFYIQYYLSAGAPLTNATLDLHNNGKEGRSSYIYDQWETKYYRSENRWRRFIDKLLKRDDFERRYGDIV